MTTNFFTTLASLGIKAGWKLNVINTPDNRLVVSVLFFDDKLDDKEFKQLQPLQFNGTPEELDNEFFPRVEMPAKATSGLFTNAAQYMKSLEEAKKNTQQEKDKKGKEKKADAPKEKTFECEMQNVDDLIAKEKYADALMQLPKAEIYPDNADEIEEKREELWALQDKKRNTLFS
jgi:PRTRC genetic system protein E